MTTLDTAVTTIPNGRSDKLIGSLRSAVLGLSPSQSADFHPSARAALEAGGSFRPVSLGEGIWAGVRSAADGSAHVLFAHNLTAMPVSFTPGEALPEEPGGAAQLYFLAGASASSTESTGATVSELEPHGFVWLARFSADAEPRL
ncbi:hypothetical protein [Kitasatospora sp. NPDC093806]|uniref:hypothetical protein n=1 Tax=Kitasatospora sp. NPDC093806 TaxID=3155075 RepID=UPI00341B4CD2